METIQTLPAFKDIEINGQAFKIHTDVMETGGCKIIDEGSKFPAAISSVAKKIAKKTLQGEVGDLMKTPAPAYVHHPITHLNLKCNESQYVNYLTQAASVENPQERMKLVIAYFLGGFFISPTMLQLRVPLNPILGETLQREMPTGEKLYCEQISHHPPITAFSIHGPNREFQHYGSYQFKGWLNGMTSIGGSKTGVEKIKFQDGTVYRVDTFPTLSTEGFMTEPVQIFYDKQVIVDETNGITTEITFNPTYDNSYSGMGINAGYAAAGAAGSMLKSGMGMLWGSSKKKEEKKEEKKVEQKIRADEFSIKITQNADGQVLSQGNGSWLTHLEIDNNVVWRIDQDLPLWEPIKDAMSDGTPILQSDSSIRIDVGPITQKLWEEADANKLELEEAQRRDAKLREEAKARRAAK